LSDVEPITAMMDPPSSFIFENIPFHLKHHLWFKTKPFCFSKARLGSRKPFNKIGNQGMVNSSKEENAAIGLAPNSYQLMHHSSDKEFKITRNKVNAPGLALCCRGVRICSIGPWALIIKLSLPKKFYDFWSYLVILKIPKV
jgi:hypothetical protein